MTKKDKQGVLIIIGVCAALVSVFILSYRLKASMDNFDHETLCRNDREYSSLKLLIDKTDPWTGHGRVRLAALIRRIKDRLAENERFSIYVLDETGTYTPAPVFDMCNPGRGEQANNFYENPRMVQQKYEDQFAAPLDRILDELLVPGVASQSPILETMTGLKSSTGRRERLVIVSDMMQNSDILSLYRQDERIASGAWVDGFCGDSERYASIEVHVITRPALSGSVRQHARNFWSRCLAGLSEQQASWESL